MDEVTQAQIAAEFPLWETWDGIDGLRHARIVGATPPVIVRGDDWTDLLDQIRATVMRMSVDADVPGRNSIA
jgi:hypothetical protein